MHVETTTKMSIAIKDNFIKLKFNFQFIISTPFLVGNYTVPHTSNSMETTFEFDFWIRFFLFFNQLFSHLFSKSITLNTFIIYSNYLTKHQNISILHILT